MSAIDTAVEFAIYVGTSRVAAFESYGEACEFLTGNGYTINHEEGIEGSGQVTEATEGRWANAKVVPTFERVRS